MDLIAEKDVPHFLPSEIAWRYKIIPYKLAGNSLTLLVDTNEYRENLVGELEVITGYEIYILKEDPEVIKQLLSKFYRMGAGVPVSKIFSTDEHSKVDDFLHKIVFEAKDLQSSDIHIESYADKCRMRFRIDGKLIERYRIPKEHYPAFINKVKIKAGLDIAEKRLPQDGRILLLNDDVRIDIRVSVLPTLHGEKIVLRLLNNDSSHIQLESLGLDEKQLSDFKNVLKKPNGILLISGPTGSGKTTTLYATLKLLNKEHSNILTVEDPIEYTLDGINQVQLKENIGLTFSSALRTFLRQDPDIIMLGEIRDAETAQMAIRAALTGHLVLSTIHTNSAWGIISRLVDMNVPTFLLASTLNMAVAQRLVRKLCSKCKQEKACDEDEYRDIKMLMGAFDKHYIATGCNDCFYTGYAGRVSIYEVIPIDSELTALIKENVLRIDKHINEREISTLKDRAITLVKEGVTSLDEIYPILLNH